MTPFSRRRFLTIAAASAAGAALPARAATIPTARWQGQALGAGVSMQLAGLDAAAAAPIFADLERELQRLEAIFSVYRAESEVGRLNRDGMLPAPSPELLQVLSLSGSLHRATGGAFDPTVQPLWLALATGQGAAAARARVGWDKLRFDAGAVRFTEPGMAITLNGIAQGAITDRIAALLRARGLRDVLVDMGEIAALGHRADGADWSVGIADPAGRMLRRMTLTDRALATSAPLGTVLDPATGQGHILNPAGGAPTRALVSVSAPDAALADGLSTALCLLSPERGAEALAQFPQARLEAAG